MTKQQKIVLGAVVAAAIVGDTLVVADIGKKYMKKRRRDARSRAKDLANPGRAFRTFGPMNPNRKI